jgi:hypothetical protein
METASGVLRPCRRVESTVPKTEASRKTARIGSRYRSRIRNPAPIAVRAEIRKETPRQHAAVMRLPRNPRD